ncbi:group II truncated hemoglobin [uncultured Amphritea sp.]|uniref:group II truncated hemoglobin n=1 Tax=uncultured Amphritea sp. TaxID=981605 RepID=UPI002627D08B|nr:group II truncated hemoglobin [uncultured Amphritea sp.]
MSTPYELLGGEVGVRSLANEFYQVMAQRADASTIRAMHAKDTSAVAEKLFMFLSGWMGGPDLYFEKHGTVCLSGQHAKFAIGSNERDQWLRCMDQALVNLNASDELIEMLKDPVFNLAEMMRNAE